MRRSAWLPVPFAIVLFAAACGDDEEAELSAEPTEETAEEPATATTEAEEPTTTTTEDAATTTPTTEGGGTTMAGPIRTIEVIETEFDLRTEAVPGDEEPLTVTLDEAGTYTFRAVNEGSIVHGLEVEGQGLEAAVEEVQPGQSAELTVTLEPGTYEMYCPVADHKERGMDGAVEVAGP